MKQLWTTLADRRRAGPPAFRRKYRPVPKTTLSLLLGGRLFLRGFGSRGGGRGPLRALSSYMGIYYKNIKNFQDLKNWPYDFPETLHASPYWLVMKKCRRQFFRNWTGCGDRRKKRLFLTPKKRQIWGKSAISFEWLVLAAQARTALL